MKKSEIKDLYNQSDEALGQLRTFVMILPYVNGEDKTVEHTLRCAGLAEALFKPVKAMCDYMIDDGSFDMTDRLQSIKKEVHKIESEVAKWANSYKQTITNQEHRKMISDAAYLLCLNCRAIINNIKDVEVWADNKTEPHPGRANNGQTADTRSLIQDKQQEKPKPTRGRGRPKATLKDKMIDDPGGEKLQEIHAKMNGKKGKDAALIILACIDKGWMMKPTFTQVSNEFGDIGCRAGYNKYLNACYFTKEEIEGVKQSLIEH